MKKKFLFVFTIVLITLSLTACGSTNPEVKSLVSQGDKAMTDNDFSGAVKYYAMAFNKDNSSDILSKLTNARKNKFNDLVTQYHNAYSNRDFPNAISLAKQANELKGVGTASQYDEISKDLKDMNKYLVKQKVLDEYEKWAKPYVLSLEKISNDWLNYFSNYAANRTSATDFSSAVNTLLQENQPVLSATDTKSLNLDPSLSDVHSKLLQITTDYQQSFSGVLGALNQNDSQSVLSNGNTIGQEKQNLTNFISSLRNYADSNQLKDNFNTIVVSTN